MDVDDFANPQQALHTPFTVLGSGSKMFRGLDLFRAESRLHAPQDSVPMTSFPVSRESSVLVLPPATPSPQRPRQRRTPQSFELAQDDSDEPVESVLNRFIKHTNSQFLAFSHELTRAFERIDVEIENMEHSNETGRQQLRDQLWHRCNLSSAAVERVEARMDIMVRTVNSMKDLVAERHHDAQAPGPSPALPAPAPATTAAGPADAPHMAEAQSLRQVLAWATSSAP